MEETMEFEKWRGDGNGVDREAAFDAWEESRRRVLESAARQVAAVGCICEKWDIVVCAEWEGSVLVEHDPHCPIAIAASLREDKQ